MWADKSLESEKKKHKTRSDFTTGNGCFLGMIHIGVPKAPLIVVKSLYSNSQNLMAYLLQNSSNTFPSK